MGIEWQIVNTKKKVWFDLDKGAWSDTKDIYYKNKELVEFIQGIYPHLERNYCVYVKDAIHKFLEGVDPRYILITNDCDDSFIEIVKDNDFGYPWEENYRGPWHQTGDRFL